MKLKTERVSPYEIRLPRQGSMKVDASVYCSEDLPLEPGALQQLADGASMTGIRRALATPDIHHGFGVPIGSVLGFDGTISPAAVGYDINCGMRMLRTDLEASEATSRSLAAAVRREIPLGEGKSNVQVNKEQLELVLARGVRSLPDISRNDHQVWEMTDRQSVLPDCERIEDGGSLPGNPAAAGKRAIQRGLSQLATLGGGNHFIEFQAVDEIFDPGAATEFGLKPGQLVVMIHSGSRGLGHQVGGDYMKLAKEMNSKDAVASFDIASREGKGYWGAMNAAANYAFVNRHLMGLLVIRAMLKTLPGANPALLYDVPHNIAKLEQHGKEQLLVHRKGATRAFGPHRMKGTRFAATGQPVLIPGSMGTASYLLSGVDSSAASLASVNHGAGRVMSRVQARGKWKGKKMVRPPAISDSQFEQAMDGVYLICENNKTIKEEAPQAYKDIDLVMKTVSGARLGNLVARMKPLAVLKG